LAFIVRSCQDARSCECQIGKYCVHLQGKSVFYPENRGYILIRNVSNHIPNYALSHKLLFYSNDNIRKLSQIWYLAFGKPRVRSEKTVGTIF